MRFLLAVLCSGALLAQADYPAVRRWRASQEKAILEEFTGLVKLPNLASDLPNIRKNADHVKAMLAKRGVDARLLELPNIPPVVFGEIKTPGAKRTLIFYAHYDGQPVDPKQWAAPPWEPVMRHGTQVVDWRSAAKIDPEWRMFGRSTSDDKAPIVAMVAALDALKATGGRLRSNIKFFFEGEEEAGSTHLEQFAKQHKDLLAGDLWLICDGPLHQNRQQSIVYGVRGVTGLELTVYGPNRELHSGHYGNWAPNPAMMLSRLLATMTDGEGRATVEGYYDGIVPLTDLEKKAIAAAPSVDDELLQELGLARADGSGAKLLELLNRPSLNVRGITSAATGPDSRNVIPSQASASLDLRLVKGTDHRRQRDLIIAHVKKQGYYVIDREPTQAERRAHAKIARITHHGGYNAVRTPVDLPICREVVKALEAARGPVVQLPTMGGSVPLWVFDEVLHTPLILTPIANHDNNQHSHNENLRMQNLWDGIETMAALLTIQ